MLMLHDEISMGDYGEFLKDLLKSGKAADAHKLIPQDFGKPLVKGQPDEKVVKLAEEHTKVEDGGQGPGVGERREVFPAHCCATMNLHRECVAVRGGRIEAVWAIEASGRYD